MAPDAPTSCPVPNSFPDKPQWGKDAQPTAPEKAPETDQQAIDAFLRNLRSRCQGMPERLQKIDSMRVSVYRIHDNTPDVNGMPLFIVRDQMGKVVSYHKVNGDCILDMSVAFAGDQIGFSQWGHAVIMKKPDLNMDHYFWVKADGTIYLHIGYKNWRMDHPNGYQAWNHDAGTETFNRWLINHQLIEDLP